MKILITYDSFFGNTQKIAKAIKDGFGSSHSIIFENVSNIKNEQLTVVDLLIVGSPTRGFRPSPNTSSFLKKITIKGLVNTKVAAFDTRLHLDSIKKSALKFIVDTGGYAAKPIAKQLIRKGGELIVPPEGFFVTGEEGPLKEDEIERAKNWAVFIEKNLKPE
ncbi:MAG: flavodoxin family protein [Mariniphaga sp.]|nr:flavodoxin family protein [Mariniphaga sp.]